LAHLVSRLRISEKLSLAQRRKVAKKREKTVMHTILTIARSIRMDETGFPS
jgi:hypothetical protein